MPIRAVIVLVLLLPIAFAGRADAMAGDVDETSAAARDPLGRDTPRGTIEGFLKAAADNDFERAARFLDLRNLPETLEPYSPATLARALNLVLERATWLDFPRLSESPEGHLTDGLPSYRDVLDRLQTSNGEVELWLQRVPSDLHEGALIWQVSNRSVAKLPRLYAEYRFSPPVEYLRARLPDVEFLGLELFKWVWSLTFGLVIYLVFFALARLVTRPAIRRGLPRGEPLRRFLQTPLALAFSVVAAGAMARHLGMSVEARRIADLQTLYLIMIGWVVFAGINFFRDVYIERLRKMGRTETSALISPLTGTLKALIGTLLLITWLDNAGYDIGALLAGLGIGGVAVALVLQRPLEDVFAAFTLFTQQPIRVGDFGRFGDLTGTVEEITLRTTRIRTLENTVVAIANTKFAAEPIENISARQRILYRPLVRLDLQTTPTKVEHILESIRGTLSAHPRVLEEGQRVRLLRFGEFAIEVEAFAYIDTVVFAEYLEIAETLNLAIMRIVEDADVRFAAIGAKAFAHLARPS